MKKSLHVSNSLHMPEFLRTLLPFFLLMFLLLSAYTVDGLSDTAIAHAATTGGYHFLGNAYGRGGVQRSLVGPGTSVSKQLYYLTYTYINGTMDLVTIDPITGHYQVYTAPVSSEEAAWAMTVGPDQNMYIGTLPNAHLLEFNTTNQKLIDLGRVPADPRTGKAQTYIWQLTTSAYNQTVYGCTYPSGDLVSYNPLSATPLIVNLGSMDASGKEQYAHSCVADAASNAPYIYVGMGSVNNQLVVYNIATHTITTRINQNTAGFASVYKGADGLDYGTVQSDNSKISYRLSYGVATMTTTPTYAAPSNALSDGGYINASDSAVTISYPNSNQSSRSYAYTYPGKKLSIYRLGSGPDGKIYGGTALPYDFFSYNPANTTAGVQMLGQAGGGQPYALHTYQNQLYITAYSATPLAVYNPLKAFSQANPTTVSTTTIPTDLRSWAISGTPGNRIYVGSIASYGKLTGPLLSWNVQGGGIQTYYPVANQSIVSLATTTRACQGSSTSYCLVGGTTIYGGTGSVPATSSARLFTWDTVNQRVLHTYPLPASSSGQTIAALITNPSNGYVYGIASGSSGSYLFIFDPASGRFINNGKLLPLSSGVVYNSLTIYQGKLWGEAGSGFFSVNLSNVNQVTIVRSPVTLSAGFARVGNVLYATSGSGLWSYMIV